MMMMMTESAPMDDGGGGQTPSLITPKNMRIIIGACLAITGNLLISVAMNIQKYSLSRLAAQQAQDVNTTAASSEPGTSMGDEKKLLVVTETSSVPPETYLRSKLWWVGITLMLIGEAGNFMAYGFGPASVVAPLGTATVVANAYIAIIFLGERLRWQDVIGTYTIIVGAFLIITFSTQEDTQLTAAQIKDHILAWPFILYFVAECVLFFGAIYLQMTRTIIKEDHVILHILPGALIASLTIISAKAVAGMIALTMDGNPQWQYPMFYLMLIILAFTGIIQVKFVTSAMQEFDSTVVVPTYFVFFTLSAILAGIFFYAEFWGLSFVQVVLFCFGFLGAVDDDDFFLVKYPERHKSNQFKRYAKLRIGVLNCFCSFLGVYLITQGRSNKPEPKEEDFSLPATDQQLSTLCPFPYVVQQVQPAGTAGKTEEPLDGSNPEPVQPAGSTDVSGKDIEQSPDNPESWLFSSDTAHLDPKETSGSAGESGTDGPQGQEQSLPPQGDQ